VPTVRRNAIEEREIRQSKSAESAEGPFEPRTRRADQIDP